MPNVGNATAQAAQATLRRVQRFTAVALRCTSAAGISVRRKTSLTHNLETISCLASLFVQLLSEMFILEEVLRVVHILSAWYLLVLVFASSLVVNVLQILATIVVSLFVNKKAATAACQWAANLW